MGKVPRVSTKFLCSTSSSVFSPHGCWICLSSWGGVWLLVFHWGWAGYVSCCCFGTANMPLRPISRPHRFLATPGCHLIDRGSVNSALFFSPWILDFFSPRQTVAMLLWLDYRNQRLDFQWIEFFYWTILWFVCKTWLQYETGAVTDLWKPLRKRLFRPYRHLVFWTVCVSKHVWNCSTWLNLASRFLFCFVFFVFGKPLSKFCGRGWMMWSVKVSILPLITQF